MITDKIVFLGGLTYSIKFVSEESRQHSKQSSATPISPCPCPMTLEKNNDDYGFHKYAAAKSMCSAIARRRLNFRNSRSTRSEDLCVVGIAVKAITLWGQKCQSSSRTILQLLKISGNRTAAGSLPIDLENCHPVRQCN